MPPDRWIILSDVHLGPGGPLTTFAEAERLASLLGTLKDGPSTGLVLAGDVFDFLQVPGYSGFNRATAVDAFDTLAANPDTRLVLDALSGFVAQPRHTLTVLAGNHDPELLLPAVRAAFTTRVGHTLWADHTPLVAPLGKPAVYGLEIAHAGEVAWVVHGDRWDPNNTIDRTAILLGEDPPLPVGSHLVFEVLSGLKPHHPWIDELKPEFPAVLLLLLYLDPERTWTFLERHAGLTPPLLKGVLQGRLRRGPLYGGAAESPPEDIGAQLGAALGDALSSADGARLFAGFDDWADGAPTGGATLAEHGGFAKAVLRAWLAQVRATDRFGDPDHDDGLAPAAQLHLPPHVDLLVAGHTHGLRARQSGRLRYLNTGTWIPVASVPPGDLATNIDHLEVAPWPRAAPRTFAMLVPVTDGLRSSVWRVEDDHTLKELTRV